MERVSRGTPRDGGRAVDERLDALVAEHGLDVRARETLAGFLGILAEDPSAPTTVTEPAEGVDVHVADTLVALDVPAVRDARRIADLGAGAGIPGLVLAAVLPTAQVALVESVGRKCRFLERAVAALGLRNVEVVNARAEAWPAGIEAHDLVTARAVAPLTALVEYAAPLLALDGHLVAWKGRRDAAEEADGAASAAATGMMVGPVLPCTPFPGARDRHLHLYSKVSPTPDRFPRREGMARKRPILASGRA